MDSAQSVLIENRSPERPLLNLESIAAILWECAWNAFIRAFLIQILATVAIDILSDVFREMTPSLPPIGLKLKAENNPGLFSHVLRPFVARNEFWIIFALLFTATSAARFVPHLRVPKHRRLAAVVVRLNRRIFGHWFKLFVLNAFAAWVSTIIIIAVQQFSWMQIAWNVLSSVVQPLFEGMASILPGGGSLNHWLEWYSQNQAKFLFWLLYSAAICDDLGLPNYKSLLRLSGQRLKRYYRVRWGATTLKA